MWNLSLKALKNNIVTNNKEVTYRLSKYPAHIQIWSFKVLQDSKCEPCPPLTCTSVYGRIRKCKIAIAPNT